ncbi:hypothetical protein [Pseudorhodoplanes sinuspersici]
MIGNVWELTNDWCRPGNSRSAAVYEWPRTRFALVASG